MLVIAAMDLTFLFGVEIKIIEPLKGKKVSKIEHYYNIGVYFCCLFLTLLYITYRGVRILKFYGAHTVP